MLTKFDYSKIREVISDAYKDAIVEGRKEGIHNALKEKVKISLSAKNLKIDDGKLDESISKIFQNDFNVKIDKVRGEDVSAYFNLTNEKLKERLANTYKSFMGNDKLGKADIEKHTKKIISMSEIANSRGIDISDIFDYEEFFSEIKKSLSLTNADKFKQQIQDQIAKQVDYIIELESDLLNPETIKSVFNSAKKEDLKKYGNKASQIILELLGEEEQFLTQDSNETSGFGNLEEVSKTFDDIKNSLLSISKIISDVGDGEEFSPLMKVLNSLNDSILLLGKSIGLLDDESQSTIRNLLDSINEKTVASDINIQLGGAGEEKQQDEKERQYLEKQYKTWIGRYNAVIDTLVKNQIEYPFDLFMSYDNYKGQYNSGQNMQNIFGLSAIRKNGDPKKEIPMIIETISMFRELVNRPMKEYEELTTRLKEVQSDLKSNPNDAVLIDIQNTIVDRMRMLEVKMSEPWFADLNNLMKSSTIPKNLDTSYLNAGLRNIRGIGRKKTASQDVGASILDKINNSDNTNIETKNTQDLLGLLVQIDSKLQEIADVYKRIFSDTDTTSDDLLAKKSVYFSEIAESLKSIVPNLERENDLMIQQLTYINEKSNDLKDTFYGLYESITKLSQEIVEISTNPAIDKIVDSQLESRKPSIDSEKLESSIKELGLRIDELRDQHIDILINPLDFTGLNSDIEKLKSIIREFQEKQGEIEIQSPKLHSSADLTAEQQNNIPQLEKEITKINELRNALKNVREGIDSKNKLFQNESKIVEIAVNSELENLRLLNNKIDEICTTIKELNNQKIDIDIKPTEITDIHMDKPIEVSAPIELKIEDGIISGVIQSMPIDNGISEELQKQNKEQEEVIQKANEAIDALSKENEIRENKVVALSEENEELKKNHTLITMIKKDMDYLSKLNTTDDIKNKASALNAEMSEFNKELIEGKLSAKEIADKFDKLQDRLAAIKKESKDPSNKFYNDSKIKKYIENISKLLYSNNALPKYFRKELEGLSSEFSNALSTKKTVDEVDVLIDRYDKLNQLILKSGKNGKSWMAKMSDRLTDMNVKLVAQYLSWQDLIRYIRTAVDTVIELDTNITELRKVSDASENRLAQSFEQSSVTAKELGSSISDVISITSDWARLGYDISQAEELAKVTTLFNTVGDNMNADSASEFLVSSLQGFQLEADQAISLVDKYNEVANNFAIDTAGIGEALKRSAASFNAANTDISQSIALITATRRQIG